MKRADHACGRRRVSALLVGGLFVTTALTEGCGLLFTHGPPANHEQLTSFSCTESRGGPIVDFVVAGLSLVGVLSIAGNPDQYENNTGYTSGQGIASGIAWALVTSISGAVGMEKVNRCLAAKRELAARHAQADSARAQAAAARSVQSVEVWPAAVQVTVGDQVQLHAQGVASSGSPIPDLLFTWSSSNEAIASVSKGGLVTANDQGKVVVAATTNGLTGTASIVVVPH